MFPILYSLIEDVSMQDHQCYGRESPEKTLQDVQESLPCGVLVQGTSILYDIYKATDVISFAVV